MSGSPLEGHCPPRRQHHTQRTESWESRSPPLGGRPQKPSTFILHGDLLIHLVTDTRQYSLINTHALGQNPAPLHGSNRSRSSPWLLPVAADEPPSLLFCPHILTVWCYRTPRLTACTPCSSPRVRKPHGAGWW